MADQREIRGEGITLRPTRDPDLPALRRLFTDPGFYEYWDGYPKTDEELLEKYTGRRSPTVECFLVMVDNDVVGFVQYYVTETDDSGGMDMVLRPDMRGQGIGTRVVRAVVQHARDTLGWSHLIVDPHIDNQRGVNFWRNIGFEPQGIVGDDHDQHWNMTWDLHRP